MDHQYSVSLLFPKGDANTSDDRARTAYFRAEESLALAREQLARSERTLGLMAEEVEGAQQCIGVRKLTAWKRVNQGGGVAKNWNDVPVEFFVPTFLYTVRCSKIGA